MKLIVPTNWDGALIEGLRGYPVEELYGKMRADFFGGGRPAYALPWAGKGRVKAHVAAARAAGIEFNYLLNAACLGNREFSRAGQRGMRRFVDWLTHSCGVRRVTVASPYLLRWLKRNYPPLHVTASVLAHIDTPGKIDHWRELGADRVVLGYDGNRNFTLLRQAGPAHGGVTTLIVNLSCLRDCPYSAAHGNLSAHASHRGDVLGNFCIDYYFLACAGRRLEDPVRFIQSPWIRPEDLSAYEALGFGTFKISGRTFSTATILRIVAAYAARRYNGNLLDLLDPYAEKTGMKAGKAGRFVRYLFRPGRVKLGSLLGLRSVMGETGVFIDNRALDGFLGRVAARGCAGTRCGECGLCREAAQESLRTDAALSGARKAAHARTAESLETGEFF